MYKQYSHCQNLAQTLFLSVRTVFMFRPDGQLPPISKMQLTSVAAPPPSAIGYFSPDETVSSAHLTSVGTLDMLTASRADPSSLFACSCSSPVRTFVALKKAAGA